MQRETIGTVIAVSRQAWLKINRKAIRAHSTDGAVYPHILKVGYQVDGVNYTKRKWLGPGRPVPAVGESVKVRYAENEPNKAELLLD